MGSKPTWEELAQALGPQQAEYEAVEVTDASGETRTVQPSRDRFVASRYRKSLTPLVPPAVPSDEPSGAGVATPPEHTSGS